MNVQCGKCGHINDKLGSRHFCEVCHARLPAPNSPESLPSPGKEPPQTQEEATSVEKERPRPTFHPPTFARARVPETPSPSESARPLRPAPTGASRRVDAAHSVQRRAAAPPQRTNELVGTIIEVSELPDEEPDPDIARILLSLLLTVDLILIAGSFAIWLLVLLVVFVILAAVFNAVWLTTLFGFLFQTVFFFLSPLIGMARNRNERQLEPVTNYVVRTQNGNAYTFRIKGRLEGARPAQGNRVRVWGRPQHGILRFQGGVNLDNGEPYILPRNWSWLLLLLLVIVNIAAFFWVRDAVGL